MRGDHFVRQWCLLSLVSRPGGLTVADGARELGCSVRTVWRDLRALQDAGLPLYGNGAEDGGRQSIWLWHRSQTFRDRPDGRLELALEVADTIEIRRWVLGFAGDAEVLEPASLRDAIRREAERLIALPAPAAVAARDGIGMDRKPAARRKALAPAPSRPARALKRNRAGARRRA